jgi:hypothetical protein
VAFVLNNEQLSNTEPIRKDQENVSLGMEVYQQHAPIRRSGRR